MYRYPLSWIAISKNPATKRYRLFLSAKRRSQLSTAANHS